VLDVTEGVTDGLLVFGHHVVLFSDSTSRRMNESRTWPAAPPSCQKRRDIRRATNRQHTLPCELPSP
jgi:hypothetical protein